MPSQLPRKRRKMRQDLFSGRSRFQARRPRQACRLAWEAVWAFSFDYARRLKGEQTALFVEFPFAAAPSHRGGSSQPGTATSLATLYVVPSLRLQAFVDHRFSPWLSGGFGYGWLETSAILNNGVPNPAVNRNAGTAQFGGGVDIRTRLHLFFPYFSAGGAA